MSEITPGATSVASNTGQSVSRQIRAWYWAARPFTLTGCVSPVLVGSFLAFRDGPFSWWRFVLVALASLLIQVAANLVDEYSDHARPEGRQKLLAPYKVIALGLLSSAAVKRGAIACFAAATIIGGYLVAVRGLPILFLCIASVVVAYLYSGGPKPLGTLGMGQPLVFVFMGPVMVMGAYYVQTGAFTAEAFWLSLPVACTVTAILAANDLRDQEEDRAAGKTTIVTLLGHGFAKWELTCLVMAAFILILVPVLLRITRPSALLAFLALPQAVLALRRVWRSQDRAELASGLRAVARFHGLMGIMLAAGVALG